MRKDNSKFIVLGIIIVCFLVIGVAGYYVFKPSFSSKQAEESPSTSQESSTDSASKKNEDAYAGWQKFVYAPTNTTLTYPPAWQAQSFSTPNSGQISVVRQPAVKNEDGFSVTLSNQSLVLNSIVTEVESVTLNNGKAANLVYLRRIGVAEGNVTDVMVASGKFEVGQEIQGVALEGVGSSSVYVVINLLPPAAQSNPGRARDAFRSSGFDQAILSVKTLTAQ